MAICKHWVWHWLWFTYSCGCIVAFSVVVAVGVGCGDVHMAERSARVAECSVDSAKGSEIFFCVAADPTLYPTLGENACHHR